MKKLFIILTIIAVWCASYIIGYNTTSTTTNLLLIKPAAEDQTIDWYSNMNDNLDLIDAAFDDPMAYSDDTIVVEDFADDDWGEASIASNVFSIDDDVLLSANFADEDWGDMSVSSNSVTLDENVVDATALHVSDVSDNIAADIAEGELADSIIVSADIKDGVIAEADLKVVNSPNDEEIFSYEATTGDFEWHTLAELSIQPLDTALTNISALVYVSPSYIKLTADDTYAVRTLDEVKTDLGINPTKVYTISPSGADYTTIQAALTANSAGGELFLVYPGTYTNDTINFTANDQCVVGVGLSSQQYVTHTQTIITLGAYTGCKIHNIKMKMTVTGVDDLMTGSGSLAFRECWLEVAASGTIAGIVPIFNTTGTVKMNRGSLVSANTAASAGQVKRVIALGAGAVITLNRVDIDITGSGAATAHTLVYGSSTGKMNIYRCDLNIDDDAATITAGLYDNSSGAFELQSNTIHVYNDVGSAYGYYFTTGTTKAVRSIYNHIGVISSGGTSNSWLVGANVTLTSQFDDVVATTSSVTGTLVLASSVNDGDISLSSELYADTIAEYTADAGVTVDGVLLKDSLVSPVYGGTGVANNAASTITVSGNFGTTFTVGEATAVTLPASGTLATLAGTETFTNKTVTLPVIKGTSASDLPTYSAEFLDADNWTSVNWTGSWAAGWDHTIGNVTALSHDHNAVASTRYQITYTVTGRTAGTFVITFGGGTSSALYTTGAWAPTTSSTAVLVVTPTTDFDGAIVISIKSITNSSTPLYTLRTSDGTRRVDGRVNSYNYLMGLYTGQFNTTGDFNTVIGNQSFYNNTTGYENTGVGYASLYDNTTGFYNSALGYSSLANNTSGNRNTGVGAQSLYDNTIGYRNSAVGYYALHYNTDGNRNSAVGYYSLGSNTTGDYSTAMGESALFTNTTGNNNTALGANSLFYCDTGSNNIGVGNFAGKYETGSNAFYINSLDRTNTAGDKAKSLIYGVIAAAANNQSLTFNAHTIIVGGVGTAETDLLLLRSDGTDAGTATTLKFVESTAAGSDVGAEIVSWRTNTGTNGACDLIFRNWNGTSFNNALTIKATGNTGIGTTSPSGTFDINVATDADPHILLSENDVTMWDIFSQHDDNDKLVIKAGATKRYEFGTDGTANADVAWGTFSPVVEGEGKELLAIALEDANKPVKPYEGIPVVKTDEELFDMIPTPHEEEVPVLDNEGVQLTNPFGKPLFETVIKIKDEKVYRPRKDNEFATEAEKQVEYDKYHKVPAKISIANAKYLDYLTGVIDAMQLKIDELEARIIQLEKKQ